MIKDISESFVSRSYFKPQLNVVVLWVGIFVLSAFSALVDVPETYFSSKRNIFNQCFVKLGWMWTLLITGPYMILTAFVYGGEFWRKSVLRAFMRLACATGVWYFWTKAAFPTVENLTGVCVGADNVPNFQISDKPSCKAVEGAWNSFDISGHCFLLTYSILFISSEVQIHQHWHKIPSKAPMILQIGSRSLVLVRNRFKKTLSVINCLFVLNNMLSSLWYFMIFTTCLYFHSFLDKPLGAGFAIISWMATYNEWFKYRLSPGLPGKSQLFPLLSSAAVKQE